MMNRKLTLAGIVAASVFVWAAPGWCVTRVPRATLESVVGTVKVQRGGQAPAPWLRVTEPAHHRLYGGDRVRTSPRATATIFIDGTRLNLASGTEVIIPPPTPRARGAVACLRIAVGKVFIWIIGGRGTHFGSQAAIAAPEGTKFVLEVSADGTTVITVLEGSVPFYNDFGRVLVGESEQSTATVGSAPSRPMRVDPSGYFEWEASLEAIWLGWETRFFPSETRERLRELSSEATDAATAAPNDVPAQLRVGDLLHDLGDLAGAEAAYRRALELEPENVDAALRLGFSLLGQARTAEAEAAFVAAAKLAPEAAEPLIGQAAAQAASGRDGSIERATETLAKALALKPDNALGQTLTGLVNMRQGAAKLARAALERAIALDPNTYQAHAHLSVVELAEGNIVPALTAAQKAVGLAPASGLARESLATVHFFAGDLQAARDEVDLALEASPNSATAHLLSSDIYVAEGNLTDGLAEAEYSVSLDPLLGPAYSALGMILLAENDLRQAERAFVKALELSPKLVAARTGMGVTYARQGNLALAMAMQKAAVALDSARASTHNNKGAVHLAVGELTEAVAEFEAALTAQPDWSMPHANLAIAYLDLNRFADAVREGELAVKLGERSARVHTTLARVYLEQNRTNKAWAALRRALELDKSYPLAHLQMAEVFVRQGKARDALRHQLEAITTQPSAMLESREYSRTEATVSGPGLIGDLKNDGRRDSGQNSYFIRGGYENTDWDRRHSRIVRTSVLGIGGRQTAADHVDAVFVSWQREARDKPGVLLASGAPEDRNYESDFEGLDLKCLTRRVEPDGSEVTLKLGYSSSSLEDWNPDSLRGDPKPFQRLELECQGPTLEARVDRSLGSRSSLVAGVALSAEETEVSGLVGTPNLPGSAQPVTWTPFSDSESRDAATLYLWHRSRPRPETSLMLGGRLATRKGMEPVARPEAYLRHKLAEDATLVVLTRPVLRDDVSELSPVDDWALRDWISPLDLATGGFSQSYELQYELTPADGSLLRLSGFHRTLKNFIVDLDDPRWAPGQVGMVLASGTFTGGEIEWEHWVGRDLSAGIWLRYTDSENDDAGGVEIPYQPKLAGQLRLDYMDENGVRVGVAWLHIGRRYADIANTTELGSYNLINLRVAKQRDLHTDLFLSVENLFDQDYAFWQGYPGPGTRVSGGVEYRY